MADKCDSRGPAPVAPADEEVGGRGGAGGSAPLGELPHHPPADRPPANQGPFDRECATADARVDCDRSRLGLAPADGDGTAAPGRDGGEVAGGAAKPFNPLEAAESEARRRV